MSDTPRQITGPLIAPDGSPIANRTLTWFRARRRTVAQGGSVIVDEVFRSTTDAAGEVDVEIVPGSYLARVRLEDVDRYFEVSVPEGTGTLQLQDLIDTDAPPITPPLLAEAQAARDAAVAAAAQAALYDGPWLNDMAALLADEVLEYGVSASGVAAGDIVRTRAEGYAFRVADDDAIDHHVSTAGGVRLYVVLQPNPPFPQQFSAVGDGQMLEDDGDGVETPTDDSAALAAALAAASQIKLSGIYGVGSTVNVDRKKAISAPNSRAVGMKALAGTGVMMTIGGDAPAAGVSLDGFFLDGQDLASKLMVLGSFNNNNSRLRDVRGRRWVDVGVEVGANSDQLIIDRVDLGPARASATDAVGLKHTGPGPIYTHGVSIFGSNGVGYRGNWSAAHAQLRANFHVGGCIVFEPAEAKSVLTLSDVFIENTGVNSGSHTPPAGSPAAVLCDGATARGGIVISRPKRIQSGWASDHIKAINGGWIEIDCSVPWVGNNSIASRALRALDVGATPGDGSYIKLNGAWRYDDWSRVSTLLRARPQSNGYPVEFGGGDGQLPIWTADVGSSTGWTPSANATGLGTASDGLVFTCAGIDAFISFTIPAAVLAAALGKPLFLRVEMTAAGSGQLAMTGRLVGDGLTQQDSIISWQAEHGYGVRTYHVAAARHATSGDVEVRIHGNANGTTGSTAEITVHAAQVIATGVDGPLALAA